MTDQDLMTLSQARGFLREAMETMGPDFVYNPGGGGACYYTPQRGTDPCNPNVMTGCLVGTALKLAGCTPDQLSMSGTIQALWAHFSLTRAAMEYFTTAQVEQDTGGSWGHAFDLAEMQVSRLRPLAEREATEAAEAKLAGA